MRKSGLPMLVASAILLTAGTVAHAHSEMDKPLFVASDGDDRGRCLDAASPCRTISYALGRVGKGGQIRVADGRYSIGNVEDLFHVVSGIVSMRGGFTRSDRFAQPGTGNTTLTGVPVEYRSLFASHGFHVVADQKAADPEAAIRTRQLLAVHKSMQSSMKAAPCVGGQSGNLACSNTQLLAHVPFAAMSVAPSSAADIWGFVDLNTNREYTLVGYNIGTAIFDVSDPGNPREVGFIDGQNTTWRDIKVVQQYDPGAGRWNAYAYVTTDGSSDGLFVIDLTGLPQQVQRASYNSDFSAAHNVFASSTDFGTGLPLGPGSATLIVAGSDNGGGRYRAYSLDNPAAPEFLALPSVSNNDYMHDAASSIIYDARKDTQCVNATDYCEVLFDFNETTFDIWDITDAGNPARLSRTPYTNSRYTHSGWPSEDGRYLFVHDELDEQAFGLQTTLRVFDLANLAAPVMTGGWTGPSQAIDHNGFVRGNRYYMSNYSRGLTILDISDPTQPGAAGHLDTYPFSDNANFVGAWGVYPYLHSGNIAVSDISSGFYMVADDTLDSVNGSLSFSQSSFAGVEGSMAQVTVRRSGGSAGAVSVSVQLVPASADNDDASLAIRTLNWGDSDTSDKTLQLDMHADGVDEGLEKLLLRLVAPSGGATLRPASVASVYISEPGEATVVSFAEPEIQVAERGFAMAVVVLQRTGSAAGDARISYSMQNSNALSGTDFTGPTSGTIQWADGDAEPKWIEFAIVDDNTVENDEYFELALLPELNVTAGANASTRINIFDGDGQNNPPIAAIGSSLTVTAGSNVTLNGNSSSDPDGDTITWSWTQTLGPTVSLTDADTATPVFTAPSVSSDTLLRFELTVTDPRGLSDTATTNVTVRAPGNSGGSSGGGSLGLLLLSVLTLRRLTRRTTRTGAV
jgi:choice-of-anchor B domain-containing protein